MTGNVVRGDGMRPDHITIVRVSTVLGGYLIIFGFVAIPAFTADGGSVRFANLIPQVNDFAVTIHALWVIPAFGVAIVVAVVVPKHRLFMHERFLIAIAAAAAVIVALFVASIGTEAEAASTFARDFRPRVAIAPFNGFWQSAPGWAAVFLGALLVIVPLTAVTLRRPTPAHDPTLPAATEPTV